MARDPKADWYWPLGSLSLSSEVFDFFPEEAQLLGVITILWNRQEEKLKSIYLLLIASKRRKYAEAIWDRQPTHQARRDLLSVALQTVKLTKRQHIILEMVIDKTKVVADRRNELLHAEYVVHGRTDKLHAQVKSPRSSKPPKYQPAMAADLLLVIRQLENLLVLTEGAWFEFQTRSFRRLRKQLEQIGAKIPLPRESRQSGSDLPSVRRTHGEEY